MPPPKPESLLVVFYAVDAVVFPFRKGLKKCIGNISPDKTLLVKARILCQNQKVNQAAMDVFLR